MHSLLHTIKHFMDRAVKTSSQQRMVIAVSGGVDSTVLLDLMQQLKTMDAYHLLDLIVAHFNHKWRDESEVEAQFIENYCIDHQLPYMIGAWQSSADSNNEASAREARYHFFADVLTAFEADVLVLAHHADDQAETQLMRWMRGTSLRGTPGIQSDRFRYLTNTFNQTKRIRLLRPLLTVAKADLYEYADEKGLTYFEDETNLTGNTARHLMRKEIVPRLKKENPQLLKQVNYHESLLTASYQAHFEHYMAVEANLLACIHANYWVLDVKAWLALSQSVRLVYLSIYFEERLRAPIGIYSQEVIYQVNNMMESSQADMNYHLPNQWYIHKSYDWLIIAKETEDNALQEATLPLKLKIGLTNQRLTLPGGDEVVLMETKYVSKSVLAGASKVLAVPQSVHGTLYVRHRQPGDRMLIDIGKEDFHFKKVTRIMIDDKIPKVVRQRTWLLVDETDQVLAILPYRVSANLHMLNPQDAEYTFIYYKTSHLE